MDSQAHPVNEDAATTAERMVNRHGSIERARGWALLHAQSYERLDAGYAYWCSVVGAIDQLNSERTKS